jgi:hypothetical protein
MFVCVITYVWVFLCVLIDTERERENKNPLIPSREYLRHLRQHPMLTEGEFLRFVRGKTNSNA